MKFSPAIGRTSRYRSIGVTPRSGSVKRWPEQVRRRRRWKAIKEVYTTSRVSSPPRLTYAPMRRPDTSGLAPPSRSSPVGKTPKWLTAKLWRLLSRWRRPRNQMCGHGMRSLMRASAWESCRAQQQPAFLVLPPWSDGAKRAYGTARARKPGPKFQIPARSPRARSPAAIQPKRPAPSPIVSVLCGRKIPQPRIEGQGLRTPELTGLPRCSLSTASSYRVASRWLNHRERDRRGRIADLKVLAGIDARSFHGCELATHRTARDNFESVANRRDEVVDALDQEGSPQADSVRDSNLAKRTCSLTCDRDIQRPTGGLGIAARDGESCGLGGGVPGSDRSA